MSEKKNYIAGIDEAGYGPRLGPLVISAALFERPRGVECLWRALEPVVTRKYVRAPGTVPVNDSKKIYNRARGISSLERTVLSFLPPPETPGRLYDFLREYAPGEFRPLGEWYDAADTEIPAGVEAAEIESQREKLAARMRCTGVALRRLYTVPIHPCRLNRALRRSDNKSVTLFEEAAALVGMLLDEYGAGELEIVADKQGGRHYYGGLLAAAFPEAQVKTLHEDPRRSSYRIDTARGGARITFRQSAESGCLPVALASMTCKYVRELFMQAFNRYWRRKRPGLRSTAGYPVDAARFLTDIEPLLDEMKIEMQDLVRSR